MRQRKSKPIPVRINAQLLDRIDKASLRLSINRSQTIRLALATVLPAIERVRGKIIDGQLVLGSASAVPSQKPASEPQSRGLHLPMRDRDLLRYISESTGMRVAVLVRHAIHMALDTWEKEGCVTLRPINRAAGDKKEGVEQ